MKRIGLLLVITVMVIGTVFAQNQERERRSPPETITVEGTLQLQNGYIVVASGDTVYYVPMLQRYVGFIEGLKEGNKVTIEGYAHNNFLRPTKVSLGGKSYDFPVMGYGGFAQRQGQKNEAGPAPRRFGACPGHGRWQQHRAPAKRGPAQRPPDRRPDPRQQRR